MGRGGESCIQAKTVMIKSGPILSMLVALAAVFILPMDCTAEPKPRISNAQFMELLVDMGVNGTPTILPVRVTKGLGLTHDSEALTVKLDSFRDDAGAFHFIGKLDNDAGYIVSVSDSQTARDFHVDKDRVLISAISITGSSGVAVLSRKEAQKILDAEWEYWAGMAEQLTRTGVNLK
jgi:hypothetical protein